MTTPVTRDVRDSGARLSPWDGRWGHPNRARPTNLRRRRVRIEEAFRSRGSRRSGPAGRPRVRPAPTLDELEEALAWASAEARGATDRARLEPPRRRRGRRRARRSASTASSRRVEVDGDAARRRRRRAERRLPPPRARGRPRRLRVRLRDPRHGRRRRPDERRRLRQRLEGDPRPRARRRRGRRRLAARPTSSASRTGTPRFARAGRRAGRVPARAERARGEIRATVAELQARRKATQPTNKRTFGSVFKNPEHELGAGADDRGTAG